MEITVEKTPVGQLVAEKWVRAQVFENFGIDYCCAGSKSLAEVCAEKGLNIKTVLEQLAVCDAQEQASSEDDWSKATISQLIEHIIEIYHKPLRTELPHIEKLLETVTQAHGDKNSNLKELQNLFKQFRRELEMHMDKEEFILFPMCKQLETSLQLLTFHCGSIMNPIRVMLMEHDSAARNLEKFRELTNDFQAPSYACASYKALLVTLAKLEQEMHQHVHKENSLLFPKISKLEASLAEKEKAPKASC